MKNFIQDFGYNLGRYMILVFVLVLLFGVFAVIIGEANECEDTGGTYVRGIMWFQCVGGE